MIMTPFDPSLELQAVIRQRLLASPDLMVMIPADNVRDVTGRPAVFPCVLLGEAQTVPQRFSATVHHTLHVWHEENALVKAKQAAGLIAAALHLDAQMEGVIRTNHFTVLDMRVTNSQCMRDPHGPFSHAVITVTAIVKEIAS